jgi:hypothetical protein
MLDSDLGQSDRPIRKSPGTKGGLKLLGMVHAGLFKTAQVGTRDRGPEHASTVDGCALLECGTLFFIAEYADDRARDTLGLILGPGHEDPTPL